MIILGIDPGTAKLGFGLIKVAGTTLANASASKEKTAGQIRFVAAGCLTTKVETAMGERLHFLYEEVGKIIKLHKPDVMAIEQLFFGVNSRTAMAVGQARGVVLAVAAKHKVPIFEYQGLSVKFTLTGFGRSDKKQMQESVRKHLRMKEIVKPDDAADGLAIAITHHIKTIGNKDDNEKSPKKKNKK